MNKGAHLWGVYGGGSKNHDLVCIWSSVKIWANTINKNAGNHQHIHKLFWRFISICYPLNGPICYPLNGPICYPFNCSIQQILLGQSDIWWEAPICDHDQYNICFYLFHRNVGPNPLSTVYDRPHLTSEDYLNIIWNYIY